MNEDADSFDEDPALDDEYSESTHPSNIPESAQSGGANSKHTVNQGRTSGGNINVAPEDRVAPADREELIDEEGAEEQVKENEPSFPARLNVSIEKPTGGSLQVEITAQDGEIVIDNVYYYGYPKLADPASAELDWTRRNLYEGPPFGNLDEELQVLLERYLDERGINTALALWVPEYIDFKEQREYLGWLSSMFLSSSLCYTDANSVSRCQRLCGCMRLYNMGERYASDFSKPLNTKFHFNTTY